MTKPVSIQQRIRILDAQGVSWREISRRLGVSRDTVRKYATMEDCLPKPAVRKGRRSLIDAHSETVDSWLSADRLMPRKQRHTARRVYARLVEDEGFEGSYSSVQRYVKRWREEHWSDGDGYLELDWSAGVMQVDFGEAVATIGGGDVRVHCLVATFPHSNMRYVAAMPGENAECVCEGLAQIFDHIGMAPRVPVLDNATGAGHRVAWNKVTWCACSPCSATTTGARRGSATPYSGNEKGSVENAVGFLRRNLMVPKAQRGEPQAAGEASAVEVRRDRGRGPLPFRQADTRAVRRGPRGDAAAAARAFRRGRMGRAQGRQGRQHPDRLGPMPRGPVMARLDAARGAARVRGGDRTADGRHVNTLPRSYGNGGRTAGNPATLLPRLARKPNAWGESPLRGELPDGLVRRLDALDPGSRRRELTLLHRASVASGFGNAVLAMAAIVEGGRAPDEASLLALARRIAQGDPPDPDDGAGRLAVYDAFNNPDGKGTES